MSDIMWLKIICFFQLGLVIGAPVNDETAKKIALDYLPLYGYLPLDSNNNPSEDEFQRAVAEFQTSANLAVTGEMNKATLEMMRKRRCGVEDKRNFETKDEFKVYVIDESTWRETNLTYKILSYPRNLSKDDVDNTIRRAFDEWSDVSQLKFEQKTEGEAYIEIKFVTGEHKDNYPFTGPNGTLAHAFYPGQGGDIHFDDDETWQLNPMKKGQLSLFHIAVHEIGHSVGLSHSKVQSSMMYPFYDMPYFQIDEDDKQQIQSKYRERTLNSRAAGLQRIVVFDPKDKQRAPDKFIFEFFQSALDGFLKWKKQFIYNILVVPITKIKVRLMKAIDALFEFEKD